MRVCSGACSAAERGQKAVRKRINRLAAADRRIPGRLTRLGWRSALPQRTRSGGPRPRSRGAAGPAADRVDGMPAGLALLGAIQYNTNCKHFYSFSSSVSPTRHRAWSPCSRMFLCLGSPSGLPSLLIFPHPVSRQGVVALLAHVPRRDALPAPASGQRFQALQIRRPVPGRRRGNAAAELVRRLTRGGMNAAGKRGRNECCETRRMAHFQRRRA